MNNTEDKSARKSGAQDPKISDYRFMKEDAIDSILHILSKPDFNQKPENIMSLRINYRQYIHACKAIEKLKKASKASKSDFSKLLQSKFDIDTDVMLLCLRDSYDMRNNLIRTEGVLESDEISREFIKLDTENQLISLLRVDDEIITED